MRVKIPVLVTGRLKEMTELCPEVPTPNKNPQPCGFPIMLPAQTVQVPSTNLLEHKFCSSDPDPGHQKLDGPTAWPLFTHGRSLSTPTDHRVAHQILRDFLKLQVSGLQPDQ